MPKLPYWRMVLPVTFTVTVPKPVGLIVSPSPCADPERATPVVPTTLFRNLPTMDPETVLTPLWKNVYAFTTALVSVFPLKSKVRWLEWSLLTRTLLPRESVEAPVHTVPLSVLLLKMISIDDSPCEAMSTWSPRCCWKVEFDTVRFITTPDPPVGARVVANR